MNTCLSVCGLLPDSRNLIFKRGEKRKNGKGERGTVMKGESRAINTYLGDAIMGRRKKWMNMTDEEGRAKGCAKCAGWKARKKRTRPFDTQDPPHFPAPSSPPTRRGEKRGSERQQPFIPPFFTTRTFWGFILYIPFFHQFSFPTNKFLTQAKCSYTQRACQALNRLSAGRGPRSFATRYKRFQPKTSSVNNLGTEVSQPILENRLWLSKYFSYANTRYPNPRNLPPPPKWTERKSCLPKEHVESQGSKTRVSGFLKASIPAPGTGGKSTDSSIQPPPPPPRD